MLKKFKNKEGVIEIVGLSRSTVCFKIGFYKCWKKFPALKNSNSSSHFLRNNFKLIKTVHKSNEEPFS